MANLKPNTKVRNILAVLLLAGISLLSTLTPLSASAYPITMMNFTEDEDEEQGGLKPKEFVSCYLTANDYEYIKKQREVFNLEETKELTYSHHFRMAQVGDSKSKSS